MQITNFSYEVIVNDDASTDNTRMVIEKIASLYPDVIKPVYQHENKYSKGVRITRDILFPIAQGEYIALCEGDDFWTNPYKLQMQVDALELHKECNMCLCRTRVCNENGHMTNMIYPSNAIKTGVIPPEKFLD